MKLSSIPWGLVPGVGQVHLGRAGKGVVFFTLFALCLNAYLVLPFLLQDRAVRSSLLALAFLLWLASAVDYARTAADAELEAGDGNSDE